MTDVQNQKAEDRPQSPPETWVPLQRAHFYFRSEGYLHSDEEWQSHAENMIEDFADDEGGEHPEWFEVRPVGGDRSLDVEIFRMILTISPTTGHFRLQPVTSEDGAEKRKKKDDPKRYNANEALNDNNDRYDLEDLLRLEGDEHDFLRKCRAYEGPAHFAVGVDWHMRLVEHLIRKQHDALAKAVACGAAHVMARRNDVLSAFERVMPDQLNYFSLAAKTAGEDVRRQALLRGGSEPSASGVGPSGAKLFSVHIASATAPPAGKTPLEECREWIQQLVLENPDGRPFPKAVFLEQGKEKFEGNVSARAIIRLLERHQPDSWSHPGRPKES